MSVSIAFTILLYETWQGISSLQIIPTSETVLQQSRRCFLPLTCWWILTGLSASTVQVISAGWDCFWRQGSLRRSPRRAASLLPASGVSSVRAWLLLPEDAVGIGGGRCRSLLGAGLLGGEGCALSHVCSASE